MRVERGEFGIRDAEPVVVEQHAHAHAALRRLGVAGVVTNRTGGYFDTNIYAINRWFNELRARTDGDGYIGANQPLFEALWAIRGR